jgi:hypothetical protein
MASPAGRDEPHRVDLAPIVLQIVDERADDRYLRAFVRHADERAVLRDDLGDEATVRRAQPDVDVTVVVLHPHALDRARRDRAAVAHVQPIRVVHAGERVAAAAVGGDGRSRLPP